MQPTRSLLPAFAALVWCGCSGSLEDGDAQYPNRSIKLIVPFSVGGGTDTFARTIKRAIDENDLLSEPVVIINVGGAGATIGSRRVKDARPDGYTVLILHDGIVMSKYAGRVSFGPEAFEPVAATSETDLVIAVHEDAPYENLVDLLTACRKQPDSIIYGSDPGTPARFNAYLLEQSFAGARFRHVQSSGGAERCDALVGGHIDVTTFSVAEFVRFEPRGLRALATLGAERHPAIPAVPAAKEQGVDVVRSITQYWWMPEGTPPERVAIFASALKRAMETEYVQQKLAEVQSRPLFLTGERLRERVDSLDRMIAGVRIRRTFEPPDFPAIVLAAAGALALVVAFESLREGPSRRASQHAVPRGYPLRYGTAAAVLAVTLLYVLLMHTDVLPYLPATIAFLIACGAILAGSRRRLWPLILATGLLVGGSVYLMFTRIFTVDLP